MSDFLQPVFLFLGLLLESGYSTLLPSFLEGLHESHFLKIIFENVFMEQNLTLPTSELLTRAQC